MKGAIYQIICSPSPPTTASPGTYRHTGDERTWCAVLWETLKSITRPNNNRTNRRPRSVLFRRRLSWAARGSDGSATPCVKVHYGWKWQQRTNLPNVRLLLDAFWATYCTRRHHQYTNTPNTRHHNVPSGHRHFTVVLACAARPCPASTVRKIVSWGGERFRSVFSVEL